MNLLTLIVTGLFIGIILVCAGLILMYSAYVAQQPPEKLPSPKDEP